MPRPRKPGAPEPKRRSRNGCWGCKQRRIACTQERPACSNCQKRLVECDYSIRLNWEGRKTAQSGKQTFRFDSDVLSEASGQSASGQSSASQNVPVVFDTDLAASASASVPPRRASRAAPGPDAEAVSSEGDRPRKRSRHTLDVLSPQSATSISSISTADNFASARSSPLMPHPLLGPGAAGAALGYTLTSPMDAAPPPSPSTEVLHSSSTGEVRRLSVKSLLTGPPGLMNPMHVPMDVLRPPGAKLLFAIQAGSDDSCTCYGIDRGFVDLDVGKNDDVNAISDMVPAPSGGSFPYDMSDISSLLHDHGDGDDCASGVHGLSVRRELGGSYYETPVIVRIPRKFEPLPSKLLNNPMNLLYFHHFLNHTAKVLVPFDGPQSNPFRTILPQLAVRNDHLLSLMLAYSASHRARLLQQPEPVTRIALWVQDIFPALRAALSDPNQSISNTNVATAIMLASLEIISPTAFGYSISWQRHLSLARELISARPGGLRWSRSVALASGGSSSAEHEEIQVCNFLWSWFAYLDVLGSLSGGGERDVSSAWILDYKVYAPEDDDEIDCIMGFSTSCVYILAKIAELARRCASARRLALKGQEKDEPRGSREWTPGPVVLERADALQHDLARSIELPPRPCPHVKGTEDALCWNGAELAACNRAYHWAGSLHLHRRVLGKPASHPDVQAGVASIVECLAEIRRGGTAEACMVFPMFTAGCLTPDASQRNLIKERLRVVENTGMVQVRRARELMERSWETGLPWGALITTEFIG
ncbi:hypothetical protein RB594_002570 [Gaeumannomyces avenae]